MGLGHSWGAGETRNPAAESRAGTCQQAPVLLEVGVLPHTVGQHQVRDKCGPDPLSCKICPTSSPSHLFSLLHQATAPAGCITSPASFGGGGSWGPAPTACPHTVCPGDLGTLVSQPSPHPAEETKTILPPTVPQTGSSRQRHFLFPQKASESQQELL